MYRCILYQNSVFCSYNSSSYSNFSIALGWFESVPFFEIILEIVYASILWSLNGFSKELISSFTRYVEPIDSRSYSYHSLHTLLERLWHKPDHHQKFIGTSDPALLESVNVFLLAKTSTYSVTPFPCFFSMWCIFALKLWISFYLFGIYIFYTS